MTVEESAPFFDWLDAANKFYCVKCGKEDPQRDIYRKYGLDWFHCGNCNAYFGIDVRIEGKDPKNE